MTAESTNREPIVDTHVHFWDHSLTGFHWPWLERGFQHGRLRATYRLDAPRFTAPEMQAEAAGTGVEAIIHLQATVPMPHPERETAWLDAMATDHGWPQAMVANCDLRSPDTPALLRSHAHWTRFRGVRDVAPYDDIAPNEIAAALDTVDALNLPVELRLGHDHFSRLRDLAARWPRVSFVLSHAGFPNDRTPSELDAWSRAARGLADARNLVCKISAVVAGPGWTMTDVRPWILACVDAFGSRRCMIGTNWPLDRLFGSYTDIVAAYREVLMELTPEERGDVLHGTATRVYALALDPAPTAARPVAP